jgi:hypothetical protein
MYDALFARVTAIAQDDLLNIRSKSDYHAVKTGALPIDAFVGIERCIKSGRSVWCKVFHLAQRDYETFGYDAKPGWVNARYLTLFDRGYVLIDNEANCDYVLSCDNGQCDVVSRVVMRGDKVVGIETAKIARSRLTPANHFSAATSEMEGYCTAGRYIEGYLGEKRVQRLRVDMMILPTGRHLDLSAVSICRLPNLRKGICTRIWVYVSLIWIILTSTVICLPRMK